MAVIYDIGTVQLDSEPHYVIVLGGCLWYSCDRTEIVLLSITLENIVHAVDCSYLMATGPFNHFSGVPTDVL